MDDPGLELLLDMDFYLAKLKIRLSARPQKISRSKKTDQIEQVVDETWEFKCYT